jgi:hypothetical protein
MDLQVLMFIYVCPIAYRWGLQRRRNSGGGHHCTMFWNVTLAYRFVMPMVPHEGRVAKYFGKIAKWKQSLFLRNGMPPYNLALKLFYRTTFGRLHPIAHPTCGLIQWNILHYCYELGHSVYLIIVVFDVVDYSFTWFPKIHECIEDL